MRFNSLQNQHYQNQVNKKMGYIAADTTMTTVFDQIGKKRGDAVSTGSLTGKEDSLEFQNQNLFTFESLAPNAHKSVVEAWQAAAKETGVNSLAGKSSQYLSGLFALQTELKKATGSTDVLGSTKESAAYAVRKALSNLQSSEGSGNAKTQEYRNKEKEFYQAFLSILADK